MCNYGIRWDGHYFRVHILWYHWKTKEWQSNLGITRPNKYKTLDRAIKSCASAEAVMLFLPTRGIQ